MKVLSSRWPKCCNAKSKDKFPILLQLRNTWCGSPNVMLNSASLMMKTSKWESTSTARFVLVFLLLFRLCVKLSYILSVFWRSSPKTRLREIPKNQEAYFLLRACHPWRWWRLGRWRVRRVRWGRKVVGTRRREKEGRRKEKDTRRKSALEEEERRKIEPIDRKEIRFFTKPETVTNFRLRSYVNNKINATQNLWHPTVTFMGLRITFWSGETPDDKLTGFWSIYS